MIEWMQTHRKWLVITIWIATIAFIGAGFVGWGEFQFSKSNVIAKVGDSEVTIKDFQEAYNDLFNRINNEFGGKLDKKTAKALGLEREAIKIAIQQALLREYAKDLGLYVTDEDIAKKIIEVFNNKKTYEDFLKSRNLTAKEFEESLRKKLLVEKLIKFLHIKPQKEELLSIASALYNADRLEIKILKKDMKIDVSEKELKSFWKKNKNKYLSQRKYKIQLLTIPLKGKVNQIELKQFYEKNKLNYKDKNGKILDFQEVKDKVKIDYLAKKLKRKAILAYKKLKTNNINTTYVVNFDNNLIPQNKMIMLIKNKILKPFVYKNSYVIAKLVEEIPPKPLSFEEAKNKVLIDYKNFKATNNLIKKAKSMLNNFNGKDIGFVTKYDFNKINLPADLAERFLFNLFSSQKIKGVIFLPSKNPDYVVLYKIKEQKLLNKQKYEKNKKLVYNLTDSLINNELFVDLIRKLENKYKIVKYIKE